MRKPKISVITASYNNAPTIEAAMLSVQNQQNIDIEHLIIDGGSTDETPDIVKRCSNTRTRFVSEPDNGIYDALNKGIRLATGQYIAFLHADDFLAYPTALSEVVELFELSGTDGVYADLMYVSKTKTEKIIRYWKSGHYHIGLLKLGWMPPHPTLILPKKLYEKHGLFNTNFQIAADYDFMLRLLWVNKINLAYLPKVTYKMRIGGASNRSVGNMMKKSIEDYNALKTNNLKPFRTLFLKNVRKINQFWAKQ